MKTKLLKIVRKRYSIEHYPNGKFLFGDFIRDPFTMLIDHENGGWRDKISFQSKEVAFDELYLILVKWIAKDYRSTGKRKNREKITIETLWWKR